MSTFKMEGQSVGGNQTIIGEVKSDNGGVVNIGTITYGNQTITIHSSPEDVQAAIRGALEQVQTLPAPPEVKAKVESALQQAAGVQQPSAAHRDISERLESAAKSLTNLQGLAEAGVKLAKFLLMIGSWVVGMA